MLAVDRTNEQIADLYVPYHPGVLRALARVAAAAQKHNVGLSICGDLATDVRLTPFLLGIGIHTLSMDSRQIPKIQERIMGIDLGEAQRSAAELLRMSKLADIEKRLKDLMPTM
jgi:phosphoenolpyruvate-protein kinase (PTS system EI component)